MRRAVKGAPADKGGPSVVELIRRIRAHEVSPAELSPEDRRACVEYLMGEGYSVAESAGILKVSDRTVIRDRAMVREANAVEVDPALLPRMVGRLIGEADAAIGRLRRLGRDKETPAQAKVDAERGAWGIARELVATLQRLGYLPTAIVQVRADLTHRVEEAPNYDELAAEMERIDAIRSGCKIKDGVMESRIEEARDLLARLSAGQRLKALAEQVAKPEQGGSR